MKIGEKAAYKICKDWKLIFVHYSGRITVDNIKNLMTQLSKDPDYSTNFDVIYDLRSCDIKMKAREVQDYICFIKENLKIVDKRKIAFLKTKPNQVALTHIFSNIIDKDLIIGEIFTTSLAASQWLSNPNMDSNVLETLISNLKAEINSASIKLTQTITN